jgi:SAM-dependent methyltransferase
MFIPTLIITAALLIIFILIYLGLYIVSLYALYLLVIITSIYLITVFIDAFRVVIVGYAPYVRTSKNLIDKLLTEIDFKENSKVYELGCGDGRFLRALAKQKDVNCTGYEYSLAPYLLAKLFNKFAKKKIKIYYKNFFNENLSDADYVFCYLIPKEMELLEKKFNDELKFGAIVISNTFAIKNWQPAKIIALEKRRFLSNKIYIYYR